jgi:hypothetical protein
MAKSRTVQIPGDDAPIEEPVIDEPELEVEVDAAAEDDYLPEPEVEPYRLTRERIAHMRAADVAAMFAQVDYPDGTPLDETLAPCSNGGPEQRYVVGRLLTADGWLVGVAVPLG